MKSNSRSAGYTLVEIVAASAILVIAVTMAMSGYVIAMRESRSNSIQQELDLDVQKSMERLKRDIRLTCLSNMFLYPEGPGPYEAISFPLAVDNDGDGAIELNTNTHKIIWDKQVVYHVWRTEPYQLRLTTFEPRCSLDPTQRQAQLAYVVTNGNGNGWTGGGESTSTTEVVFENLFWWEIRPCSTVYDGYSAVTNRDHIRSFGAVIMDTGTHTLAFTVIGKNSASSGYKVGLDSIVCTPCGHEFEGEAQLTNTTTAGSGAPAVSNRYMAGGSWSGNYDLSFPATATGQSFAIRINNDRWEEENFVGLGVQRENTVVTTYAINDYDYVVQLDGTPGSWAWFANNQTGCSGTNLVTPDDGILDTDEKLCGCAVRVLIRGEEMESGGYIPYTSGKTCFCVAGGDSLNPSKSLKIEEAWIAECATNTDIVPDAKAGSFVQFSGSGVPCTLGGGGATTKTVGPAGWNFPVDKKKSYLVTFRIGGAVSQGYGRYWPETNDPSGRGCWILPAAAPADVISANWSANPNVFATNKLYILSSMGEWYPTNGYFTSQIFDTHASSPSYTYLNWKSELPLNCSVKMKLRTGNNAELSDASDWSSISAMSSPGVPSAGSGRYAQFQAQLISLGVIYTPSLRNVVLSWGGPRKGVDVGGIFTQGPDYGVIELKVDGANPVQGVAIELEIFEDIWTRTGQRRVKSSLTSEVKPRNTNK